MTRGLMTPVTRPDPADLQEFPAKSVHIGGLFHELNAGIALANKSWGNYAWQDTEPELVQWLGQRRLSSVDVTYTFPDGRFLFRAIPKLTRTKFGYCREARGVTRDLLPSLYATRIIYDGKGPMLEQLPGLLSGRGWERSDARYLDGVREFAFAARECDKVPYARPRWAR